MSKSIVVTGGAGFVGTHLCERLLSEGHKVICVDNLFTSSSENMEKCMKSPQFTFLNHDVVEPYADKIGALVDTVDEVYNLACPAAPGHYQYDPIWTTRTAFLGVLHALDLAKTYGAKVLQASTSEVYGDPEQHPQKETYKGCVNPIGPRACYDEGKRVGETLMFDHHRMYGTAIRVIRIFNTYGPYMHPYDGRVISNFVRQALTGGDITVYGDGSQTRSFQYVSDLIDGIVRMMRNDSGFLGPVNLGNPSEYTILELAEKVLEKVGREGSKVVFRELPKDDPAMRRPDISVAAERLGGWKPVVSLDEGLEKTIRYFDGIDLAKYKPPTKNYENPNPDTIDGNTKK